MNGDTQCCDSLRNIIFSNVGKQPIKTRCVRFDRDHTLGSTLQGEIYGVITVMGTHINESAVEAAAPDSV